MKDDRADRPVSSTFKVLSFTLPKPTWMIDRAAGNHHRRTLSGKVGLNLNNSPMYLNGTNVNK